MSDFYFEVFLKNFITFRDVVFYVVNLFFFLYKI